MKPASGNINANEIPQADFLRHHSIVFRYRSVSRHSEQGREHHCHSYCWVRARLCWLGNFEPRKISTVFRLSAHWFCQYPELQAARDNCYHVLNETIEKGVKEGVLLARPADQLGAFLWSCIHGITSILLATVHKQNLGQQLSDSTNSATSRLENDRRALLEFAAKAISV